MEGVFAEERAIMRFFCRGVKAIGVWGSKFCAWVVWWMAVMRFSMPVLFLAEIETVASYGKVRFLGLS